MIKIYEDDQPIELAAKLITATTKIERSSLGIAMARAAGVEDEEQQLPGLRKS